VQESHNVLIDYVMSYYMNHAVYCKRQNRLKVGTDKPNLKVKMQSVSDDEKTS